MLRLESIDDLNRLIAEGIKESLTLEYKRSVALRKLDKECNKLCKDVSAFANSAGGQIAYGVEEDKHVPTRLDDGADPAITKEWIEQVIDSRVQPRIEGLIIKPIDLAKGLGFVLTIPQATARAPHQAPDKRYYKRQNFQSVPMEDYEVRDALRRSTTPDLHIDLSFALGNAPIIFRSGEEISDPITMLVTITNQSSQPAYHTYLRIGLDTDLQLVRATDFYSMGRTGLDTQQYWLARRIFSPPHGPIFKELEPDMGFRFPIEVMLHSSMIVGEKLFDITTSVQAPGFSTTAYWKVHQRAGSLRMCPPGHPLNR